MSTLALPLALPRYLLYARTLLPPRHFSLVQSLSQRPQGDPERDSNASWGQNMARAWASAPHTEGTGVLRRATSDGRESTAFSDLEEEEWGEGSESCNLWLCFISCCSPCYSCCQCAWHVGRSTPATAVLALGSSIAVALILNYYLPKLRDEMKQAGLEFHQELGNFVSFAFVVSINKAVLVV